MIMIMIIIINNDFIKNRQTNIKGNRRCFGFVTLFTLPWEWCHDDAETSAINFNSSNNCSNNNNNNNDSDSDNDNDNDGDNDNDLFKQNKN